MVSGAWITVPLIHTQTVKPRLRIIDIGKRVSNLLQPWKRYLFFSSDGVLNLPLRADSATVLANL